VRGITKSGIVNSLLRLDQVEGLGMFLSRALTGCLIFAGVPTYAMAIEAHEWAAGVCNAWNKDSRLTTDLVDKWVNRDAGRGYKIIQLECIDCANNYQSELRIAQKYGKAMCVYGGTVQSQRDSNVDYLLSAKNQHWIEMGNGELLAMRAMMFGKLKFQGPKMEIMAALDPFGALLQLTGNALGIVTTSIKGQTESRQTSVPSPVSVVRDTISAAPAVSGTVAPAHNITVTVANERKTKPSKASIKPSAKPRPVQPVADACAKITIVNGKKLCEE